MHVRGGPRQQVRQFLRKERVSYGMDGLDLPRNADIRHNRALLGIQGVRSVAVNERTGGLLLEYDAERLPLSLLSGALPLFERLRELEIKPIEEALPMMEAVLNRLKTLLG